MTEQCKICNSTFETMRALSTHIVKTHLISAKSYYDTYLKVEGDGLCHCPGCNNPTVFRSISEGYKTCCSKKCSGKLFSADIVRKRDRFDKTKATNLAKYGVENVSQISSVKEKIVSTNLRKFGVPFVMQNSTVKEKSRLTNMDKYGASTYVHSEQGTAAVKKTNSEKYGNEQFFASDAGKASVIDGCMRKYGVKNAMQSEEVKSKRRDSEFAKYDGKMFVETDEFKTKSLNSQVMKYGSSYSASPIGRLNYQQIILEKYGSTEWFKTEAFKDQSYRTNMLKYGVENYSKTREYLEKVRRTNTRLYGAPCYMNSRVYKEKILSEYTDLLHEYNCSVLSYEGKNSITYKCDVCGHVSNEQVQFILSRYNNYVTMCVNCQPKDSQVSFEELKLKEWIESLGFEVSHYDRNFIGQYGADIVIESEKIIIEYDGLYWHSELYHPLTYHLEKKRIAETNGYRLIHVFSDEWVHKKNIVKDRLKNLLHVGDKHVIFARKCDIKTVSAVDEKTFLNKTHIQGYVPSKVALGLYYNNELVALMTFGKSRFEQNSMELLRFCVKSDCRVVGAAGKLFKYYTNSHDDDVCRIVSYADARWACSNAVYGKIGFEYVGMTPPNYYYINGDVRENRIKYQKYKLVADGANPDKTEHEIMLDRGMYRIYDCGNYKYVWTRTTANKLDMNK